MASSGKPAAPRILIIDDDHEVRETLAEVLTLAGYAVLTAAYGREGIRLCRASSPDLVITDLHMPEQDGLEVIRTLHREQPALPIIAISGAPRDPNTPLHVAESIGARRIFEKPIDPDGLVMAVRELLPPRGA